MTTERLAELNSSAAHRRVERRRMRAEFKANREVSLQWRFANKIERLELRALQAQFPTGPDDQHRPTDPC